MRKINTKFFLFLVITLALGTGAAFGLHRLQAGNIAEALLWQADQAEKEDKLDRAAKFLGRYLEFAREDLAEREHLAMILSNAQWMTSPQRRARARFVIEQVLAKDPQRHVLRQRLCQIMIAGRSFDVAKEHLTYLEDNQSDSAGLPYLLGQWHEAQNQAPLAMNAYRRAIKADPTKVEAYVRLVALLKHADFGQEPTHVEEIEQLIVTVLEKAPQDAGVLSLAAQQAQEKGDSRVALKYLEDGLQYNPGEPHLYLALARIHRHAGKRAAAIEKLQLGLKKVRKDQHYDLLWSLANHLIDDNRLDDARKTIQDIRDINRLSADYLEARARMQRGRWFDAAKQFEKVRPGLKSMKELAFQVDLYLGTCYEQMEEPVLQLTAYQRAAEVDPTSLTARRGMASAHWALGQTEEALRISQELADRAKDPEEAAQRRIAYVRMLFESGQRQHAKDWKKIEQALDEIEKTLAKSFDVALLRAELFFVQGEKKKAESLLQETIKGHPDRHEPWLALISFASSQKDLALAKQLLQTAESHFKDQAGFRLAQVRFWSSHYDAEAETVLKRIEETLEKFAPREQSTILQAIAEAHYFANKYADSARALRRMAQLPLHAQDIRVRMQLLELTLLQDDDAETRAILNDIKKIEGDVAGGMDWSFGEALRLIHEGRKGAKDALEKARHWLTVAAAQRPNWHPIIQTRAELDELQGRPDQAIANYRRAIELGCRDPQAMKQLIVLLSRANRYEEVEQILQRMQKQNGTTEELVRYYVANSFNRREYRKAEYLIKKVVVSNSTNYRDHLWLGQILSTSGQSPDEAEKAFRRAVMLAPAQPEGWINLVRHLISVGQNLQAKAEIENAGKALPADIKELTLALCYELLGFLREAAENYQLAVARPSVSVQTLRAAGDFYGRLAGYAQAETLYRQVMERKLPANDQDVTAARRGLAHVLTGFHQPPKTKEALELVGLSYDEKGLVPDNAIAEARAEQIAQAKVLGSLNHHRLRGKAIAILEALQQRNALQAEDQFFLVRLYAQNGADAAHWPKARSLLKELTLQNPRNARYLAYASKQLIEQKDFAEAESMIGKVEQIERERKTMPGGLGSIELRAKMFEMRGLGTQATALLTAYAEQENASPVRKLLLASLQGRLGHFRAAIDLCEEVRQIAPFGNTASAAAVALLRMHKPTEAQPTQYEQWQVERLRVETFLRDVARKDPQDVPARMYLADLMDLQANYGEVEKLCRESLKVNDTHIVALNNLAWLLCQRSDKGAEALMLIDRAIDKHGPRPELLGTRAIVHLSLGHVEQSLRDLERAVNEAPTPTRLFYLARAHERLKNVTAARSVLRQAAEMGLTPQQLHPIEQAEYQRVSAELRLAGRE